MILKTGIYYIKSICGVSLKGNCEGILGLNDSFLCLFYLKGISLIKEVNINGIIGEGGKSDFRGYFY